MTNKEILKKAIEKAHDNGYWSTHPISTCVTMANGGDDQDYYYIIFSHSFAKAFWGIGKPIYRKNDIRAYLRTNDWQYHQHKMLDEVQAGREPLKYLEKFL